MFDEPELMTNADLRRALPDVGADVRGDPEAIKALPTDEEVAWFIEAISEPAWRDHPATLDVARFMAGLAVDARRKGMPFRLLWENAREVHGIDAETDPHRIEHWERIRHAMESLASPGWRA